MTNFVSNPNYFKDLEKLEQQVAALERLRLGAVQGCSLRAIDGENPVAGSYGYTEINLADERLDTGSTHGIDGEWTVHRTGWFHIHVMGCWDVHSAGIRGIRVVNATTGDMMLVDEVLPLPADYTQHGHSVVRYLTAGHIVRYDARHTAAAIVAHKQNVANADGSGFDCIFIGN